MLALAEDPATPLLERAKFLAIFASNLDEFYMVRVAGLKRRLQRRPADARRRPVLAAQPARDDHRAGGRRWSPGTPPASPRRSGPKLSAEGIELVSWGELDAPERERLRTYFREQVFPVLTPLAVDPAHPFPYISEPVAQPGRRGARPGRRRRRAVRPGQGAEQRAAVRDAVQNDSRRRTRFLPVEELIAAHLDQLFSGMQMLE